MKTKTLYYKTNDAYEMVKYIDERYNEFGNNIINVSTCTDQDYFYVFITTKAETPNKGSESSNID